MCLTASRKNTQDFLLKNRNRKTIEVYKFLTLKNNKLFGPFFSKYEYKLGINTSNSTRTMLGRTGEFINKGLHVYLLKEKAFNESHSDEIVVEFIANLHDLIAVNLENDEAVFKSLSLSKREYKRVTN